MTNNVVPLRATQQEIDLHPVFPQNSKLYFNAVERPLCWMDRANGRHKVHTHKCLLRADDRQQPVQLAIVGSGYKVVQNKELFQAVEEQFTQAFTAKELEGVSVHDDMAYNGRTCMRDYRFPNVRCPIEHKRVSEIAFRTIVVNGFGGSAVKVLTGAIDFFCSNGMVTGEFDTMYSRHSSGLSIGKIVDRIKRSIEVFYTHADMWAQWMGKEITNEQARDFFDARFSDRMAQKLWRQWMIECHTHGRTVWALYSAMTYYATHNEGEFKTRETDNDHAAATMLKREQDVRRTVDSKEFKELLAA